MQSEEVIEKLKRFGDPAEQLYADEILRRFPNYAILWVDFIGNQDLRRPKPFDLDFPEELGEKGKTILNRLRDQFCQGHYTVWCKLGAMHDYLNEAREALKKALDNPRREVDHRRAFDSFYSAIGGVKEIYEFTFNKIFAYAEHPRRNLKLYNKNKPNKSFLHSQEEKYRGAWENVLDIYENWRTQIDHLIRPALRLTEEGDYVIKEITSEDIKDKVTWIETQTRARKEVPTISLLEEHLKIIEYSLNLLHELLIEEVIALLERNNLKVKQNFPTASESNKTLGASPTTSGTKTIESIQRSIGSSTTT